MSARCHVPPYAPPPGARFVVQRACDDFIRASHASVSDDALAEMLAALERRMKHAGIPTMCGYGDTWERGLCAEEVSRG